MALLLLRLAATMIDSDSVAAKTAVLGGASSLPLLRTLMLPSSAVQVNASDAPRPIMSCEGFLTCSDRPSSRASATSEASCADGGRDRPGVLGLLVPGRARRISRRGLSGRELGTRIIGRVGVDEVTSSERGLRGALAATHDPVLCGPEPQDRANRHEPCIGTPRGARRQRGEPASQGHRRPT